MTTCMCVCKFLEMKWFFFSFSVLQYKERLTACVQRRCHAAFLTHPPSWASVCW